ncbi:MAG: LL-diaminopimelate aminotransferase [Sphaerochaeta sp.]|jgi:LL-diaminopimelate aminotransferase|nr:LL-diaminopimelate aminotransferase [Sphaerochaeta sp.]MCH3920400.1 LL-diaminopimelate aminotransferase [Sphaerochaeta sp.]MCI2044954.1 LL-diaminopimelate aminotransferase [Sphaerochaeta sp.]MCI2076293.1 LL-diaminopimelate aminotransferase [Sphaerochaeta sp.]MCI2096547.1 LL-diaminopimelate aminotransferase [Sphaerochaeta sp.]
MATVNNHFLTLSSGYLFPEIARRTKAWQEKHPDAKVLRLGIGNTTEALAPAVCQAMKHKIDLLSDRATYTGYGDEQGDASLRKALCGFYHDHWGVDLDPMEFFISDGAKSDAANIQELFGQNNIVAVQDPAYPVYVDSNVVGGRTGAYNKEKEGYDGFVYLPSVAENGFIPDPPSVHVDLIYLCSPNNPTGAVATKAQLKAFVDYAIRENAVIIFDAAYSSYITDDQYPHSIYQVEGAQRCAIEISSFSKFAGFTGVRLGWTVVPKQLVCQDAGPGVLNGLWNRRQCTFFNGASNISQYGGEASLSGEGYKQCMQLVDYYLENARIIRQGLESVGLVCYGGVNSPYIWARTPKGMTSWQFFDLLLDRCHVVVTPGSGFGPAGEGYVRVSAYGHREDVVAAMESIRRNFSV